MRKEKNLIEIQEDVKVGNVILEKGDKIKVIKERTNPFMYGELVEFLQSDTFKTRHDGRWHFEDFDNTMQYCTDKWYFILGFNTEGEHMWKVDVISYDEDDTFDISDDSDMNGENYYSFGLYSQDDLDNKIIPLFSKYSMSMSDRVYKQAMDRKRY